MPGVLQVLFPGRAHSFTSCLLALLVKDEHRVSTVLPIYKKGLSHTSLPSCVKDKLEGP